MASITAINPEDKRCIDSLQGRDWLPIRIGAQYPHAITNRAQNPEFFRTVEGTVMPEVISFWSKTILVKRVNGPLTVRRDYTLEAGLLKEVKSTCSAWGGVDVTIPQHILGKGYNQKHKSQGGLTFKSIPGNIGENVDLALLITMDDHPDCQQGTLAWAYACRFDDCGRPVLAAVNICPREVDFSSPQATAKFYGTIHHELTHALGFTTSSFSKFRNPDGTSRIPTISKPIFYTCNFEGGKPKVRWDVHAFTPGARAFRFLTGVVTELKERSVGSRCTCPTDPNREYTATDIESCLMTKNECIFAVTTPKVVEKSKEHFGCDSVSGAELENQEAAYSCTIYDSHWKGSMFGWELMNQLASDDIAYISSVTLALLEDSGWYRINYDMATSLVPGSLLGYKAGCDFVHSKCFKNGKPVVTNHSNRFFCDNSKQFGCSASGLETTSCFIDGDSSIPLTYRYGLNSNFRLNDYCPVFRPLKSCAERGAYGIESAGPDSRCFEVDIFTEKAFPYCLDVRCESDGGYYIILNDLGVRKEAPMKCSSKHQTIAHGSYTIRCSDPAIICASQETPHIPIKVYQVPKAGSAEKFIGPADKNESSGMGAGYIILIVVFSVLLAGGVVHAVLRKRRAMRTLTVTPSTESDCSISR